MDKEIQKLRQVRTCLVNYDWGWMAADTSAFNRFRPWTYETLANALWTRICVRTGSSL